MKKILLSVALIATLAYAQNEANLEGENADIVTAMASLPPQEITQNDISIQNEISDAKNKDITPKSVDEFFEEFAQNHNIAYGVSEGGKVFFTGKATVALPSTDPSFAKALSLAFDEAMLNLQAEFVRDAFGRQSITQIQKFFSDDSTNAREFEDLPPEGVFTQLMNKATSLVGAQLDKALESLGVNMSGLTEERKKVLFMDTLIQQMQTLAAGAMQGLVPVQTVSTKVSDSHYEVGVIAVMSPKTAQVASDIKRKRPSVIKGNGKNVREFLPANNQDYLNEYGIRMVYNEKGSPVIISYGQWSYLPDDDVYVSNRKKQNATEQAISRADSAIAGFVNTSVNFKRSQENSKEIENSITQIIKSDHVSEKTENAKNIIDTTTKEVIARSSLQLKGIRTLKTWSAKDSNGIEYVGAVRMYSYDNVANTNEILKTSQDAAQGRVVEKPSAARNSNDVSKKSHIVNDMNDF